MSPLSENLSGVDCRKIVECSSKATYRYINPGFEERSKASLSLLDEEVRSNGMSSGALKAFHDPWKRMLSWNPTFHVVFQGNMKRYRVGVPIAKSLNVDRPWNSFFTLVPRSLVWTLECLGKILDKICYVILEQILSVLSCNGVSMNDLINHSAFLRLSTLKKEMRRRMDKNFRV